MPYHGRYFLPLIDGVAFRPRVENSPHATRSRRERASRTGELDMNQLSVLRTVSSRRISGNSLHRGRRRAMGSLVLALVASLAFIAATSSRAVADTSDAQVTLTCNDGHSVTAAVDSTTLLQLTAEVQALVGDPTGLSCTLDPAGTPPASWTVYDYNPSGQAIAPRVSAASMPATTDGTTVSFPFKPNIYTALLTTRDASLTGDLSGKTLSVTVSVSGGGGTFQYQRGGSCGGPANVRFHFASPKASGTTGPVQPASTRNSGGRTRPTCRSSPTPRQRQSP